MSRYFFSAGITCSRSRVIFAGIEDDDVELLAVVGRDVAQPAGRCRPARSARCALFRLRVLLGDAEDLLVEIDADDLVGAAERLGVDARSRRCCSTGRARACRRRTPRASCGCRAGRRRSRSCAWCPGAARNCTPCSVMTVGARRLAGAAVERLSCFCTCSSANAVERRRRGNARAGSAWIRSRWRNMPAEKNSITSVSAKRSTTRPRQAVAFGMDQAVGVGDGVELQHVAAQLTPRRRSCARRTPRRRPRPDPAVSTRRAMREWPL